MSRPFAMLAAFACLAALVGCGPSNEPPCGGAGSICHVMGTGSADFNGDGRAASETALNLPTAARVGPDGWLYVMDFNNYRLRCRVADGSVDTVAGSGVHAYAAADRKAVESPLENPIDFGFSPQGQPLFVSLHDPRVLMLADDGGLVVVAGSGEPGDEGDGGPATEATFGQLTGIAVAPDGSVFVSDEEAHRVRRIDPDGTIDRFAGIGVKGDAGDAGPAYEAQLSYPHGLALDGDGNLYIADMGNHRIRRVDIATGEIDTVAGTGVVGLAGDGGAATEAQLSWPTGVTIAPDGSLFIADTLNHRIRHVDGDGVIRTVAGTSEGYAGDGGPAVEAALDGPWSVEATDTALYVADMQNHVVRVVTLAGP